MGAGMAGYLMTGVVATLMCVQARQQWSPTFPAPSPVAVPPSAPQASGGSFCPPLIIGALFGYLMKASGLWLSQKTLHRRRQRPGISLSLSLSLSLAR